MFFQPEILNEINSINNVANKVIDNLSDIAFNTNDLSIFHCNIRNINLYFNELLVYLNSIPHTFDFIILTETWLSVDLNFNINGFKTYHSLGFLNISDGVTIFIRNNIIIMDLSTNIISDQERIWAPHQKKKKKKCDKNVCFLHLFLYLIKYYLVFYNLFINGT
jgi:hypothetical protein